MVICLGVRCSALLHLNVLYLTAHYYYGCAVLIILSMEEDEEMVGSRLESIMLA